MAGIAANNTAARMLATHPRKKPGVELAENIVFMQIIRYIPDQRITPLVSV
jgi:hypothetical protein